MPRVKLNSRMNVSKALSNEQLADYFGDEDFDYNFDELDFLDDYDDDLYQQRESKDDDWNNYSSSHETRKNQVRAKRKLQRSKDEDLSELDF